MMTTKEVSDYLRIPVSSLWHLTKTGKIRGFKVGKHWRYREEDILAFFDNSIKLEQSFERQEASSERRSHPRLNCQLSASIRVPEKLFLPQAVSISNLSQTGLLIVFTNHKNSTGSVSFCRVGDPIEVRFSLSQQDSKLMNLSGRVIHQSVNGKLRLGIKFRQMQQEYEKVIKDYVG